MTHPPADRVTPIDGDNHRHPPRWNEEPRPKRKRRAQTTASASHDSRLADELERALVGQGLSGRDRLLQLGALVSANQTAFLAALRSTPAPDALRESDLAACERAIDRMGWDEIRAFMNEPGQSPSEDAGGYLLRKIKTLFGIKPDRLETYRAAARRLVAEARTEGKPS